MGKMELARLNVKCQLTLPLEIRRKIGVKAGDQVVFVEENGRVFIENAARLTLSPKEDSGGDKHAR